MKPLLELCLSVDYPGKPKVLDHLELEIEPGELIGLVGESGSGKSTLARSIVRLAYLSGATCRGKILFQGRDLLQTRERDLQRLRGREIALILQSAASALNPALRIGSQLAEAWRAHARGGSQHWRPRVDELFHAMRLSGDDSFLRRYPGQLSVGQAQRVLLAMAVLHGPALLIADEPTSALDLVTQKETLDLLAALNQRLGMGVLFISHDLLSVASICRRVAILHDGRIVECGEVERVFGDPLHPYTRSLLKALPPSVRPQARTPPDHPPDESAANPTTPAALLGLSRTG